MKARTKWLIGCGVVLLLAMLTVVGILGFVTYKISAYGQKLSSGFNQIEATNSRHAFIRPPGDVLDEERVKMYFEVRNEVMSSFMAQPLVVKMTSTDPKNKPGALELMSGIFGLVEKTITDFGEHLDKRDMSLNEYRYHAMMTYLTVIAGEEAHDALMTDIASTWSKQFDKMNQEMAKNPELRGISVSHDSVVDGLNGVVDQLPAKNIDTIAPYAAELKKNSMFTFFEVIGSLLLDQKAREMKRQGTAVKLTPIPPPVPAGLEAGTDQQPSAIQSDGTLQ
ncbi:hypothetical protein IT570_05225 [Candidatus Sumerlaeota bacterium]|nr:hypothetical protein [Candidatus Sumerlaeota bacterium]